MRRFTLVGIVALLGIGGLFMASVENAGGPPEGYTGSPADGKNCSVCHSSSPKTLSNAITIDVPPSGYVPGDTYNVTVSVVDSNAIRFGFQLSPQDPSGNLLGQLISTSNQTQVTASKKYIEQTLTGTSGSISKSWSFQWVAPPAGTGDVTFYAAINAANGNGMTTGDQIYLASLTIPEMTVAIENDLSGLEEVRIAVLPGTTYIRISSERFLDKVEIYTIEGRKIYDKNLDGAQETFIQAPELAKNQLLLVKIYLMDHRVVVKKVIL